MYTDFASVYDRLMADVPYADWARYYAGLLELHHVCPGARCVECACGTGNLTVPLAERGYRMTGMDLSGDMLGIAQRKARDHGVLIPFIRMDMRKLTVQRPVDAVLATCDGVNYLTSPGDALQFFASALNVLKPGGVLIFDVSTPYKLTELISDRIITASDEDLVYVWQGEYREKQRLYSVHLDIFAETAPGQYRRIQEDQVQRAHTQEELFQWLHEAGFGDVRAYGDRNLLPPDPHAVRWHITAVKGDL